ncbi:MAG: hypothetical protein CVV24_05365 [Ignavibacteriae bacterium HGW-Ignavibacteriae-3]|nr:MAG: hypothetical protein CVV24_05365 [Ignavibacteriae bacterium HGW-Ignavibacteriae-3]
MNIQLIISFSSMFFWIFPAARQYKTQLFWYFLVLALMDPLSIIIHSATHYPYTTSLFTSILLYAVLYSEVKTGTLKYLLALVITIMLISLFNLVPFGMIFRIICNLIIIFFFFKRTLLFVADTGKLNVFHLFLLIEEISLVLKLVIVVYRVDAGDILFHITTAFQLLIAVFFSLYREDDKRLLINLRKI